MAPARGHTTLSDLLADDVRDYFAREGVSDSQQQQAPTNRRSKSFNDRKKKQQKQKNKLSASSSSALPSSYSRSATPSERGGEGSLSPLRAGWANIETNSSPNSNTKGENAPIHMPNFDENTEKQSYSPLQQQQQQHQYQNRGQNTAERHNMNTPIRSNNSDNRSLNIDPTNNNRQQNHQQQQHHRRHSSGSTGSFQSHHSRGSRGSISSRSRNVSAADAAFLKRYAEEKERTNMRMSAAKPNWSKPKDLAVETRAPSDSSSNNEGAYHSIIQSPRPPTVVGSHRPALPSIDNDDWEEDDRIERRDKRKMERKEARKLERHRRTDSSGGSPRSASGLSVISRRSDRLNSSDRGDSSYGMVRSSSNATFGTVGNSSVVYHNPYQSQGSREISQGSIMSTFDGPTHQDNVPASAGLTPGTNASMSYSAESSQNAFLPPPPDIPYNNNHRRHNSMDRFLREQEGKQTSGEHDNRQERYSHQGNTQQSDTDERATRHVRPLSYLSASSESDGKSGERTREGSYPVIRGDDPSSSSPSLFGLGASPFSNSSSTTLQRGGSPFSSNSGASKHPLIPDLARYSSADGSDLNSTLYGSAIYSSRSEDNRTASGDSIRFSRTGSQQSGRVLDYSRQRYYEDESSDGSSYDSDESSYTSDSSYDGDSSSHSHSSNENHHRRGRHPKHTGYQKKNPNIRWETRNRDIERGEPFNERGRLSTGRNRGPKYSSIEKTRNKRNRYRSSDSGKHHDKLEGQDAMPLRLDDAIYVLLGKMHSALIILELFISNMPSLVGSLALAWASLGVDWFKVRVFWLCHYIENMFYCVKLTCVT